MLNTSMDKCVLVKGWKSGSSWSFPRGKIDQDEDDRDCAIREVFEETGFDLTGMVQVVDKIDINIREQDMRLYIAPGVPEDTEFAPRTRKEISVSQDDVSPTDTRC
jgi:mRNA-decapping enzyme subunit 2